MTSPGSTVEAVRRPTIAYQPALDGVRALAVLAVLLFHGGISWLRGGYLGVSVFFTLSGFLITSLLLTEHEHTGRVSAAAFYVRRARRLLPASLACLAAVCLMAWVGWFRGVANLRRDVLGSLFQVFNWVKLGAGESYADLTTLRSGFRKPLDHYWSLAIEEQFYWLWPLSFIGLMAIARRWRLRPIVPIAVLTGLAAIAAPVIASVYGPDAAYWATPARMCEILAGALAACWLAGRSIAPKLGAVAPIALCCLAVACALFPSGSGPAYEGALPLIAVVSAALIIGLQVDGPARRLLSVGPLVALGKVSYGVYLYHWPVFVLIDRHGWDLPVGVLLTIKCAITAGAAIVSYFLIERPVRSATWMRPRPTLVAAFAGTAVVVAMTVLVPSVSKYYGVDPEAAEAAAIDTGDVEPLVPLTTIPLTTTTLAITRTTPPTTTSTTTPIATTTSALAVPARPVRIVVIGDSTAEATGAGIVEWAAANPQYAQVELFTGSGCGLAMGGYLVFHDSERDVDAACGGYVFQAVPERVAALQPDVVMLMTTSWDVADHRLVAGGPVLSPVDPDVQRAITDSFRLLTDQLLGLGVARVVWVQQPVPLDSQLTEFDSQGDARRHQVLWDAMEDIADGNPTAVRVVDLAGWVAQAGLSDDAEARPDGVHWTPVAALQMASEFLAPALVRAALT